MKRGKSRIPFRNLMMFTKSEQPQLNEQNNMWTENEIKDLRKHAYDVFKTEIPLSGEIEKIQIFLDQSKMGFKKVNPKLIKTVSATVQWCPNFWNYPLEIDIPDSVMDAIRDQCGNLLAQRCDELAGLCNYKHAKEQEAE